MTIDGSVDYTGPCDLKIKSELFILSGFWNSVFKCFPPSKSVTLSLQVCVTQGLIAAALPGRGPAGCGTEGRPVPDAIPWVLGLAASIPAGLWVPGDLGSLAEALSLKCEDLMPGVQSLLNKTRSD